MAEQSSPTDTFLFADLAGYAALTDVHGDEHAADLVAEFCWEVRAVLEPHLAQEIKTSGWTSGLCCGA
jgi:class 3 adenylate cyclase